MYWYLCSSDLETNSGFTLFYVDEENDQMLLGTDNGIAADWVNGVFYDNFRGVWGASGKIDQTAH